MFGKGKLRSDTTIEWTAIGRKEAEEDRGGGLQYQILQKLEDNDGYMTVGKLSGELNRSHEDIIVAVQTLMNKSMVKRAG